MAITAPIATTAPLATTAPIATSAPPVTTTTNATTAIQATTATNCSNNIVALAAAPIAASTKPAASQPTATNSASSANSPVRAQRLPRGGNYFDCLSATEIDAVVAPLLGRAYINADVMYSVRVGTICASSVALMLQKRLAALPLVVAPIHVRRHWVLGVFTAINDMVTVTVVDSAPSMITRTDIDKLLRRLRVICPTYLSCGRQPRESTECGVHVVVNAWRSFLGLDLVPSSDELSYAHLRPTLIALAKRFDATVVKRIAAKPKEILAAGHTGAAAAPPAPPDINAAVITLAPRAPPVAAAAATAAPPTTPPAAPPSSAPVAPVVIAAPKSAVKAVAPPSIAPAPAVKHVHFRNDPYHGGARVFINPPATAIPSLQPRVATHVATAVAPCAAVTNAQTPSVLRQTPAAALIKTEVSSVPRRPPAAKISSGTAAWFAARGSNVVGGAQRVEPDYVDVPAERATAARNQCYLYAAMRLLSWLLPGIVRSSSDVSELQQVQDFFGHRRNEQQDPVETVEQLLRDVALPVELHTTSASLAKAAAPALLVAAHPIDPFACPAHYEVIGVIGRTGREDDYGNGMRGATFGHCIARRSCDDLRAANARPVLFALRRTSASSGSVAPRLVVHYFDDVETVMVERVTNRHGVALTPKELKQRQRDLDAASARAKNRQNVRDANPPRPPPILQALVAPMLGVPAAPTIAPTPFVASAPQASSSVVAVAATASRVGKAIAEAATNAPNTIAATQPVTSAPAASAAVEQQATAKPPPVNIPRSQLRKMIAELRAGQMVIAHWAVSKLAGIWAGRVHCHADNGRPCAVAWEYELCNDCEQWVTMQPTLFNLPHPNTVYFKLEKVDFISPACKCAPDDDEDAEVRINNSNNDDEFARDDERDEGATVGDIVRKNLLVKPPRQAPEEMQPTANIGATTAKRLLGNAGRDWHVYPGPSPQTSCLAWRQLAQSTRAAHKRWIERISGMPDDLAKVDFAAACVELVLRLGSARNWAWSTLSSALSSIRTALNNLPLHTAQTEGIDIGRSPTFMAATKRAQHLARTSPSTQLTEEMPHATFKALCGYAHNEKIAKISDAPTRLLLQLCWHFAGRTGDVRQLRPNDVKINEECNLGVPVQLTFRYGKGAAFWGPYTIHAIVPSDVAKDLRAWLRSLKPDQPIFTTRQQQQLSALVKAAGVNLRSIRRGALTHNARCGVSDEHLMLLSGHKRKDTLMRYLGWGTLSSTAEGAAATRARKTQAVVDPVAAGVRSKPAAHSIDAPKMGFFSGRNGHAGQRIAAPVTFFRTKPPSHEELGLAAPVDVRNWPLHVKSVSLVNWDAVRAMAKDTLLAEAADRAWRWCTTPDYLGPPLTNFNAESIPYARLTSTQVEQLIAAGKLVPHRGPVQNFSKGWLLPQINKQRLRPIFEPFANGTLDLDAMLQQRYPSRLERRADAAGMVYEAQFDFAAFFDQFELAPAIRSFVVIRVREAVNGDRFFALTRLPMGARQAPGVAQLVTWLLVLPLLRLGTVRVSTMIDNVRIMGTDKAEFLTAVREFLVRVCNANITLNDAADWQISDAQIIRKCAIGAEPRQFLGELYLPNETIANTQTNVAKLRAAAELFEQKSAGHGTLTYRQFAALIGLALFMAHTIDIALSGYHRLLRVYGAMVTGVTEWDAETSVESPEARDELRRLIGALCANAPVPLPRLLPPSREFGHYSAVVIVDACAYAWGAYVLFPRTGLIWLLKQRWRNHMQHSAHAEPRAALNVVRWIISNKAADRIALVTDHVALATGQRHWQSGFGGFSRAYWLNQLFHELYTASPHAQIFYVEGSKNIADEPSRDERAPYALQPEPAHINFPHLSSFAHPYDVASRDDWQV